MTKHEKSLPTPAEMQLRHNAASEVHYAMALRRISTATLARETGIKEVRLEDLLSAKSRERLDFTLSEVSRIGEFLGQSVRIEFVPTEAWDPVAPPLDASGKQLPMFKEIK